MINADKPKDASPVFCPNLDCSARGKVGLGNIVGHGMKRRRYKCKICKKTFSFHRGTMYEGLRKPEELITIVTMLLTYGCPPQAIVWAFGLDERTVASWQLRAGNHCAKIHQDQVMQRSLDLQHIQADEIRVKGYKMIAWIGLVMMVGTRLFLGGVVSQTRDRHLADQLLGLAKAACRPLCALLVLTDGWGAYPKSTRRVFRERGEPTGRRGPGKLRAWPEILIGTVIKRTEKYHVVEVLRQLTQGTLECAAKLLERSRGGTDLNTAFIERLNGTFRERLACLTRRCRHAVHRTEQLAAGMWLIGTTYNFCFPHQELSKTKHHGSLCTPAMAAKITDHVWNLRELLSYRVAPPPYVAPKKLGQHRKRVDTFGVSTRLRPLVRLRNGSLDVSTR
jgi:transposase-like protein